FVSSLSPLVPKELYQDQSNILMQRFLTDCRSRTVYYMYLTKSSLSLSATLLTNLNHLWLTVLPLNN
ncbi:MAG: hypothetical protein JW860_06405, partial [Sedimentisphaerales bacterium]|nr:hypothetical protein [Sedimentisphaerales bacterium]